MQDKLKQPQQVFGYKTPLPATSITCPPAPKKRPRTELKKENQDPNSADSKVQEKYPDCAKNLNWDFSAAARHASLRSAYKNSTNFWNERNKHFPKELNQVSKRYFIPSPVSQTK